MDFKFRKSTLSDNSLSFVTSPSLYIAELKQLTQNVPLKSDESLIMKEGPVSFKVTGYIPNDSLDIINMISYVPIELSIKMSNYLLDKITDLKSFITPLVSRYYNLYVDYIEIIVRDSLIVTYIPYYKGNKLYTNIPMYIDLSKYIGYVFLSIDPLVSYVVTNSDFEVDVKVLNSMFMLSSQDKEPYKDLILNSVVNLRREGYITLSSKNDEEISAYLELATLWGGSIKRSKNIGNSIIIHNRINYYGTAESWYRYNAKRILSGMLTRYRFTLNEKNTSRDVELNGIPTDDTSESFELISTNQNVNKVKLKYSAIKSYLELASYNTELLSSVNNIKIYDDMSIEADFFSYKQVIKYKEIMNNHTLYGDINILNVNDITDSVILRYKITSLNNYNSMIIEQNNGIYLVTDMPLKLLNYESIDTSVLSEQEKVQLLTSMKDKINSILPKYQDDINNALLLDFDNKENVANSKDDNKENVANGKDDNKGNNQILRQVPNNSFYGYFDNILIKGYINYPNIVQNNIRNIDIYRTIMDQNTLAYSTKLETSNFLVNDNIYHLTDKELINYNRELSMSDELDMSMETNETIIWNLYESLNESDMNIDQIGKMWRHGEFFNIWQQCIYKETNKFSRIKPIYLIQ